MRRLRRAIDSVGGNSSKLQFICSSATIGNPQDMAMRFSGRTSQPDRLHLIEGSGAGSAGRTVLCLYQFHKIVLQLVGMAFVSQSSNIRKKNVSRGFGLKFGKQ